MNNVKVKICGIRSLESAQAAIDAGTDFLGFNFVKESKRYIYPIRAKTIINLLRIKNKEARIKVVGIFQNQSVEEVNNIADYLNLNYVQLHGEENMEYVAKIKTNIIKTCRGRSCTCPLGNRQAYLYNKNNISYFLLDREVQGQGEMVDMKVAKELAEQYPLFLAGGLTPNNVSRVVKEVKPFAVDIASGIETNGVEDPAKIQLLIQNCRERFQTIPFQGGSI